MDDGNERCATPTSLIPEHASTCGDGEDADDGTGSSTRDSSSVGEDDDSSSEEEDVDGGGSSVGTELALELARWEVEWVPEPEAGGRSRRRGEGGGSSPRGPLPAVHRARPQVGLPRPDPPLPLQQSLIRLRERM
jgi:hypothetical protein